MRFKTELGRTCQQCGTIIKDANKYPYCGLHTYVARNAAKSKLDYLLINTKYRARKAEIPFDLTEASVPEIPDSCNCCGNVFGPDPLSRPTLDKVVPSKGYIVGNVAWICWRCNRLKDNSTLDDLRNLVSYVERFTDAVLYA